MAAEKVTDAQAAAVPPPADAMSMDAAASGAPEAERKEAAEAATMSAVGWQDPAIAVQARLLRPDLAPHLKTWAEVKRDFWWTNVLAWFFKNALGFVHQPEPPKLHLAYPTLYWLAANGRRGRAHGRAPRCGRRAAQGTCGGSTGSTTTS